MDKNIRVVVISCEQSVQALRYCAALKAISGTAVHLLSVESRRSLPARLWDNWRMGGLSRLLKLWRERSRSERELQSHGGIDGNRSTTMAGLKAAEIQDWLRNRNADYAVLYNAPIVKPEILSLFKEVFVCHNGLLPEYPGSCANHLALLEGKNPGLTVFGVRESLDTGPVYFREEFTHSMNCWDDLEQWFCDRSVALVSQAILGVHGGRLSPQPQPQHNKPPFLAANWTKAMEAEMWRKVLERNERIKNAG